MIYFIRAKGTNLTKIGVSNNPQRRLKDLQTGCPFELEIINTIKTIDDSQVESKIHELLNPLNTSGEWFDISNSELSNIHIQITQKPNIPLKDKLYDTVLTLITISLLICSVYILNQYLNPNIFFDEIDNIYVLTVFAFIGLISSFYIPLYIVFGAFLFLITLIIGSNESPGQLVAHSCTIFNELDIPKTEVRKILHEKQRLECITWANEQGTATHVTTYYGFQLLITTFCYFFINIFRSSNEGDNHGRR